MELPGETVEMEKLVSVEGENTLRRIGAGPFWEVHSCYILCGFMILTASCLWNGAGKITRRACLIGCLPLGGKPAVWERQGPRYRRAAVGQGYEETGLNK